MSLVCEVKREHAGRQREREGDKLSAASRREERLAQFLRCVSCSGISLSSGGGKYVRLKSLNLICDHPDHYKEWIEGVSPVCVCVCVGMGREAGRIEARLHILYRKRAPICACTWG